MKGSDGQKSLLCSIHEIMSTATMHVDVDEARRYVLSFCINIDCIGIVNVMFFYCNDLSLVHQHGSMLSNAVG